MMRFLMCLVLMLPLAGCGFISIIGPVVDAYVTWLDGEAHAYYATDSRSAYNAVKRTLAHYEYSVLTDDDKGEGEYYIVAGNNDRFKIKITPIEPHVTRVSIRINFMGDKPYAELIYGELANQMDIIDYKSAKARP